MKRKNRRKIKKAKNTTFQTAIFALSAVFGWLAIRGLIALLPELKNITMILIGVTGLFVLSYIGLKKF